jgi:predicted NBD/HSP70 family sugar kinase
MPLEDQINYRWIREDNAVRFVRALLEHGVQHAGEWQDRSFVGLTQALVAEKTGISRPTVSALAGRARDSMLRPDSELGLAIDPAKAGVAIGVDFSYGHNRVALSDVHGQLYVPRRPSDFEMSVDENTEADRSLAWAADRILKLLEQAGVDLADLRTIGVALAGPIDQVTNKLVPDSRPMNSGWQHLSPVEELPVRLELEERGLEVPVYLDNDTNASAIAEYCWGAARGAANTLYVKLNRSCSCSLIIRHEIYRGAQGFAGEISHTFVQPQPGAADSSGVELHDVFSVAALRQRFDRDASAQDLVKKAHTDDEVRQAFLHGARVLGEVLAPIIDVMNPELVVIGGKLGYECFPLIASEFNDAISRHHSGPAIRAIRGHIKRGQIPGRTALRGAIALALRGTLPEQLAAAMPSDAPAKPHRK